MIVMKKCTNGARVESYLVEILQAQLTKQGFSLGRIDAEYGGRTEQAVAAWQQAHGRETTGATTAEDWEGITGLMAPSLFDRLLHLVAQYEGTGMTGAVGNFDGAYLTFGLIGFTLKHDLPNLLQDIEQEIPDKAREAFSAARWEQLLQVAGSSMSVRGAFGDSVSLGRRKYKLAASWAKSFERLGSLREVQKLQIKRAFDKYMLRIALPNAKELDARDSLDMAVLYDTAIQNGGLSERKRVAIHRHLATSPNATGLARRKLWAHGIADGSSKRYHDDVLRRKMTMATGRGTVHGTKLDLACWGLSSFRINIDQLANEHFTIMPEDTINETLVLAAPVASPVVITNIDWREEVTVPVDLNGNLRAVNNGVMVKAFGNPRGSYDQKCRPPTDTRFKSMCAFNVSVDGFSFGLWGLNKAVQSLQKLMVDIKSEKPEIFAIIGHMGMGCCRHQRNSSSKISNHSWGSAIDLTVDGKLDVRGNGVIQRGVLEIAPIFHKHLWYSGATFRKEDSMHMEISRDWIEAHFPDINIGSSDVSVFLSVGDAGNSVRELQRLLNAKGATLRVDGDFGPATLVAVKAFQAQAGLVVDGIVGKKTIKILKA